MTTEKTQSVESRNLDISSELGILGYREMFDKDHVMREVFEKENEVEKNQPQQASANLSKTKIVNDVEPTSTKAINEVHEILEELLLGWCKTILRENKTFKNQAEFLSELIKKVYTSIPDPGWMNMVPRNTNDCEELLKKFGLYERYAAKLHAGILLKELEKRESIMKERMCDPYKYIIVSDKKGIRKVPLRRQTTVVE